ncbi:MAG: UDP-N-acetylmuramoyl-tripeptide--D-alanyl-D-alanine ligase [Acidobacteria bacterium]|nr:UDP-N-acetylmuramoyl-tripeptide--D-alanyl-D-alanine ligase [Acidobacteriota bacterium]
MSLALRLVGVLVLGLGWAGQMLRWLRVLQREHYEASSLARFLGRWSAPQVRSARSRTPGRPVTPSLVLFVIFLVTLLSGTLPLVVAVSALYGATCPWGLGLRGRTSPLVWTRRLGTVAAGGTVGSLLVVVLGVAAHREWWGGSLAVWTVPLTLDLAARVLAPLENSRAGRFVEQARRRLDQVHPRVVAITGSYGKTSTKNHLYDLLSGDGAVVATPKSFNNRAGLSRAINENLTDGTRVFIAEMGTYGPGEIAALSAWCVPEIAVITAIGPVHLERMGSLDVIERAKFEITTQARVVIVNADDPRLATWPGRLTSRVVRAGTGEDVDVRVREEGDEWVLDVPGHPTQRAPRVVGVNVTNVACAIAAALEVGARVEEMAARLRRLRPVANRSVVATAGSGVMVIDDTFNANPASARAALDLLASLPVTGRRWVVTPGLVELGAEQHRENMAFARRVRERGAELICVGRTNARALVAGYGSEASRVDTREEAVARVRAELGEGDAVLYLNDLPDHYP